MRLNMDVVKQMAFAPEEERTTCPICGRVKKMDHLVCKVCYTPANVKMVAEALAHIKANPPTEIWRGLLAAVEEMPESGDKAFEVFKAKFPAGRLSFLSEETVMRAVQVAREKRERLMEAADFLRRYLRNGGEFSSMPVHLASNAIRDTMGGGGFTHPLLTVASDRVIIPEETEKALRRAREEGAKADSAKTLQGMARFTASPETRAEARRRRENSSTVPAMAMT